MIVSTLASAVASEPWRLIDHAAAWPVERILFDAQGEVVDVSLAFSAGAS